MVRVSKTSSQLFSGWLKRYVDCAAKSRFPVSFQALCGMFALSSIVGRKAVLERAGYRLFPPTSILLLGYSGVGKSVSLDFARDLIDTAVIPEERREFVQLHAFEQTVSGVHRTWAARQADLNIGFLEGTCTAGELKSILAKRTGTENAAQFLIESCEHKDVKTLTRGEGEVVVRNVTVGFGFCSTVQYLRSAVSVDDFGGGLMHRFLIAHETRKARTTESAPDAEELRRLAEEARAIHANAPSEMSISTRANARLKDIQREAEDRPLPSVHLAGFWNRFDGLVAKVSLVFALSDSVDTGDFCISRDHVDTAESWLKRSLYPPLEELVAEMSYGPKERRLFDVSDDIFAAGEAGLPLTQVLKALPGSTRTAKNDAFELMKMLGIAASRGTTVYHPRQFGYESVEVDA